MGTGGAFGQGVHPRPVEGMDRIAHRLVVAAQVRSDLRGTLAPCRGEEDLTTAQGKGIGRTQPGQQGVAFGIRQRADKERSSHDRQDTPFPTTSSETALGFIWAWMDIPPS